MKKLPQLIIILFYTANCLAQTNLITAPEWTVGIGDTEGYDARGTRPEEDTREIGLNPYGESTILWKAETSGHAGRDGGFHTDYYNIDHTKNYRFTLWMKKTNSHNGISQFGFYARGDNEAESLKIDGTSQDNPYFFVGDLPELDKWYLLIGYVYNSTYTGTAVNGGVYDPVTGNKVLEAREDYKFSSEAKKILHRTYFSYAENNLDNQFFYEPTIYELNGQEPSIQDMLNGADGSVTTTDIEQPTEPTSFVSTNITETTTDFNWTASTDNVGVTGYKIYKNGVLEITLGSVTTYQATGLSSGATYQFTVSALDAAGNESNLSSSVSVTTNSSTGGGNPVNQSGWVVVGENINLPSGKVGIGTTVPDYELTVNGGIHSKEVKVDLSIPAPDYVFKESYNLKSLKETQEYIKQYGHLPNIPSAAIMEHNGIELGVMNMKLLEKIEELTLYTIQQQKEIERLKSVEERLAKLEKMLQNNNK